MVRNKNIWIQLRISAEEKKQIEQDAILEGFKKPSGRGNITQYLLYLYRSHKK